MSLNPDNPPVTPPDPSPPPLNWNALVPLSDIPACFMPGWNKALCVLAECRWKDILPFTERSSERNYSNLSLRR